MNDWNPHPIQPVKGATSLDTLCTNADAFRANAGPSALMRTPSALIRSSPRYCGHPPSYCAYPSALLRTLFALLRARTVAKCTNGPPYPSPNLNARGGEGLAEVPGFPQINAGMLAYIPMLLYASIT